MNEESFLFLKQTKIEGAQKTMRDGQKLINSNHFDGATIKYKISKLDEAMSSFTQKLQHQENSLNQTVKFLRSSVPVSRLLLFQVIVTYAEAD